MLRPMPIDPVPEETVRVERAAFRKGNRYMRLADEMGTLFTDVGFAALVPTHGQPALPPWRLALAPTRSLSRGCLTAQAGQAVRSRIDWKYLLRLELGDAGFDASVPSQFRSRLLAGSAEPLLLDTRSAWCHDRQLIKAGGVIR